MNTFRFRIALTANDVNTELEPVQILVESLADGFMFILYVRTIKNIQYLLNKQGFVAETDPFIIVSEFTNENLEKAVSAFIEKDDFYSLKIHNMANKMELFIKSTPNLLQQFQDLEWSCGYQELLRNREINFEEGDGFQ